MKRTGIAFFSIWMFAHTSAQMHTPSLLSAGGGNDNSTSIDLSWSLGEMAVLTWHNDAAMCSEGFQQSYTTGLVPGAMHLSQSDLSHTHRDGGVQITPNPFQSTISLTCTKPLSQSVILTVYSPVGQQVCQAQIPAETLDLQIDTGWWQPGVYYLQILGNTEETSTVVTLVKL